MIESNGPLLFLTALQRRSVQRTIVLAALGLYVLSFMAWWPAAIVNGDEAHYVGQAMLFSEGKVATDVWDNSSYDFRNIPISTYQPGTSFVQAAFILFGGWKAAVLVSLLSLCGTVLLMMAWLRRRNRSVLFALVPLLYPPMAVLGRVAISDVPAAFLATAGLVLFWVGLDNVRGAWLAAGFIAGLSSLFREATPLLFLPLFAGALLRRRPHAWHLIAGAAAGLLLRTCVNEAIWGIFLPPRYQGFGMFVPPHPLLKISLNLFALLVMVPGGLWAVLRYRGELWPEIQLSVFGFVVFYTLYYYDASQDMLAMQLILEPRFLASVVPLVAFTMGATVPRMLPSARAWLKARPTLTSGAVCLTAGIAAFELICVHPVMNRWARKEESIRSSIYSLTTEHAFVVLNFAGGMKFTSYAYGSRKWVPREDTTPELLEGWRKSGADVFLVFVNRNDSADRLQTAKDNEHFEADLRRRGVCQLELLTDKQASAIEHLRILRLGRCAQPDRSGPGGNH